MSKVILAINTGSSSLKVSVYSYENANTEPNELAAIQVSGLTAPPATLKYDRGEEKIRDKELQDIQGPESAFDYIIKHLTSDPGLSALNHPSDISFVCHRIVHGGPYTSPTRIDRSTYHHLEELSSLAPLHNGPALTIVHATHTACPTATNLAFFDTAFHATLPTAVSTYPISPSLAARHALRKYGFHGLSYAFITRAVAAHLARPAAATNLIALHLGSGASAACIRAGRSADTSMGLTPLSGLPGATRAGDVDASLAFRLSDDAASLAAPASTAAGGARLTRAEEVLNREAGWAALAGTTDFGEILRRAGEGDEACGLAFEVLVDRIVGFVGSYFVKLGGQVDALVFAGGIGEKGAELRRAVVERVACLGFELDRGRNETPGEEVVVDIGRQGAQRRILVCRTDEQVEMAIQCAKEADQLRQQE